MVPIKAASEAMPPRPPHHPPKGGERSKAAGAQAVRRQTTVTRAPRSRARLISVTTHRRLVAKPRTPHLIPQAAQLFKIETANVRGQGARPLAFLWGFKGGFLFGKRIPPLSLAAAQRAALTHAAPSALHPPSLARDIPPPFAGEEQKPPSPGKGEQQKGASCEAPFFNQISRRSRRSY